MSVMSTERSNAISGLMKLALFLAEHPDVPLPYLHLTTYVDQAELRRAVHLSGAWSKSYTGPSVYYRKDFDDDGNVALDLCSTRACTKRVVGHRTVPATEAYELEIVEWDCAGPND
jgi:hypothetical protein